MLIKVIFCHTTESLREAFSSSQAQWTLLKNAPGFLGQLGGWNRQDRCEACIVGFWQDEESYQNFMRGLHDEIVASNQQQGTYQSIEVRLYEQTMRIPGGGDTLSEVLSSANVMQVSVRNPQEGEVGYSERTSLSGMLGGCIGKSQHADEHVEIIFWQQFQADPADKIADLVEEWSVLPFA